MQLFLLASRIKTSTTVLSKIILNDSKLLIAVSCFCVKLNLLVHLSLCVPLQVQDSISYPASTQRKTFLIQQTSFKFRCLMNKCTK